MRLLNTVVIERNFDPNNIIKLPKKNNKQSKLRFHVFVKRVGADKFNDNSPDSPYAKGFWVEDVSQDDFEFIRDKDYAWVLGTTPDLEKEDIYQWYNRWEEHRHEIANRVLQKLGLDNKKYEVYGYDKCTFQPTPTLHQIKK